MTKRVIFPQFELVGPPCKKEGCSGVLVDHASWVNGEFFRRCSVCNEECDRMPVSEKLAVSIETIQEAFDAQLLYDIEWAQNIADGYTNGS